MQSQSNKSDSHVVNPINTTGSASASTTNTNSNIQSCIQLAHCPITLDWMKSPVTTHCGHTFDHHAISKWASQHHTCPICKTYLTTKYIPTFIPNYHARSLIELLAPKNTLSPPPLPHKFKIFIHFYLDLNSSQQVHSSNSNKHFKNNLGLNPGDHLIFYVKPTTPIIRIINEYEKRLDHPIKLYHHNKLISYTNDTTVQDTTFKENSNIQAILFDPKSPSSTTTFVLL